MKTNILFIIGITVMVYSSVFAQISGNQAYGSNSNHRVPLNVPNTYTTDSTLVITSKVLLNEQADHYILHIGVDQLNKTVGEANANLSARINHVLKKIKGLGISKKDIYVDFISKIKIYDHDIIANKITENFMGYRIQKNLIIKFKDLNQVDEILEYCALEDIHDIIKVDYVNNNIDDIQDRLLAESEKVIERKKKRYIRNSSVTLSNTYKVSNENLKVYYPKNLYKKYNEAHETSFVTTGRYSNYIKKQQRKATTFYYDGADFDYGVDKIIDDISPIVGIQYVFEFQIIYNLKN